MPAPNSHHKQLVSKNANERNEQLTEITSFSARTTKSKILNELTISKHNQKLDIVNA